VVAILPSPKFQTAIRSPGSEPQIEVLAKATARKLSFTDVVKLAMSGVFGLAMEERLARVRLSSRAIRVRSFLILFDLGLTNAYGSGLLVGLFLTPYIKHSLNKS
jgi:hypothetical protein